MRPVIIHADGTDCHHEGKPQATVTDGAPRCPGGQIVTHVRFNGQVLTFEQATEAFLKLGEVFTAAVKPVFAAFTELGRRIAADPALRALAAKTGGDQR